MNNYELLNTLLEDSKTQQGKVLLCNDDGTEHLFESYEDAIMFVALGELLSSLQDNVRH